MAEANSCAEYVLGVYAALLKDCAAQYPALTKEFQRDYIRLSSAIESHGVRFALDTMPAWRKHLDGCLARRRLTPSNLLHFGVDKKGSTIPRLFRGLVLRVFDRSGVMKSVPDVQAVACLRQLLGVVRKLRMECSIKDRGNAVIDFVRIDSEIRPSSFDWMGKDGLADCDTESVSFTDMASASSDQAQLPLGPLDASLPYGLALCIQQVADYMCSKLGSFDPAEWRFKHGPGAVSDQSFGEYKYSFTNWPDRLETVFPYADFAHANYAAAIPNLYEVVTEPGFLKEYPAVLHAVPKTITGPRLIASEPVALQWCQQAIRDFLYTRVSETLLSQFVDFRRQGENGSLALEASRSGSHSTIDLSSASDRISCWHVERLFRRSPSLLNACWASRSVWIEQSICSISPKHIMLRKYSTMGNATTFPVQSLFFLAISLGCVLHARGQRVSDRVIRQLGKKSVRVFGDDIIVPGDCAEVVVDTLQALGLRVNVNKTFTEGNFRESCGVDAFLGHDVTSANILDVPRRTSPGSIVSNVDAHNNLCERGYPQTALFIQKTVSRIVSGKIRYVTHGSGSFGWSDLYGTQPVNVQVRYGRNLCRQEVRCMRLRVSSSRTEAKGVAGLLQYFTEVPKVVSSAISTLGHLTRRPKVGLTIGWVGID